MCVMSMVGDHYTDKFQRQWPTVIDQFPIPPVTRQEFDQLRKEVEEMRDLLKRAKRYDEENGEPECEMDEKVALLKQMAELVGVDLAEVFG